MSLIYDLAQSFSYVRKVADPATFIFGNFFFKWYILIRGDTIFSDINISIDKNLYKI